MMTGSNQLYCWDLRLVILMRSDHETTGDPAMSKKAISIRSSVSLSTRRRVDMEINAAIAEAKRNKRAQPTRVGNEICWHLFGDNRRPIQTTVSVPSCENIRKVQSAYVRGLAFGIAQYELSRAGIYGIFVQRYAVMPSIYDQLPWGRFRKMIRDSVLKKWEV